MSKAVALVEEEVADGAIPSKVVLDRRSPFNGGLEVPESDGGRQNSARAGNVYGSLLVWAIFWILFAVQLGLIIWVYASVNTSGTHKFRSVDCNDPSICDNGVCQYWGLELNDDLKQDLCECKATDSGRRMLSGDEESYMNMFELLGEHVYIPITGGLTIGVVAAVWLELMKKFGTSVVVFSMLMVLGIICTMAGLLFHYDSTGAAVVVLLFALMFAAYGLFRRSMILKAGKTLEVAAKGLGKNPCIFGVLIPVEVVYIGYMFLWIEGWAVSTKVQEINNDPDGGCDIVVSGGPFSAMWFISFMLLWISFYINHVKVTVVAATLAQWAFGQVGADGSTSCSGAMPMRALKWSFWESGPTLAVTSLVCTIVERIKRTIQNKCNWANPFCCCVMLLGMLVFHFLQAFGRFTVVVHAITAKPFYTAAAHSYRLLIKGGNLEHALSADFFIGLSLHLFAYFLSFGIGMASWAWVDDAENLGSFDPSGSWQTWFWLLFILFIYINRYPYVSVFILILLGNWGWLADETDGKSSALLLGMFSAAIAHIIFGYFSCIVLDAVDTMVMCFAIDKQNGLVASEYTGNKDKVVADMYVILEEMAVKHADDAATQKASADDAASKKSEGLRQATATPITSAVPEAQQTFQMIVPEGVIAGQAIQATAPNGNLITVMVPQGCGAGSTLTVPY